jgi:hypothetical protein
MMSETLQLPKYKPTPFTTFNFQKNTYTENVSLVCNYNSTPPFILPTPGFSDDAIQKDPHLIFR